MIDIVLIIQLINRNFLKAIIFISIIIIILNPVHSPAQNKCRISGTVKELSTGQPIENANVFLSGTTFGDVTDKEGRYIINNVPPGF